MCNKECCDCCEYAELYRELVNKLMVVAIAYQKKLPKVRPATPSFVGDSD